MNDKIKVLSLKDFVELGYLQELNRQFLHPRGLALAVIQDKDGTIKFGEIWDARDDIEGWQFDDLNTKESQLKKEKVKQEYEKHLKVRNKLFKTKKGIQPI
jgi:hypothetical protein